MNLEPTVQPRERILGFGAQGTGKSRGALSIAKRCKNATLYVVDNDMAWDMMLLDPDYPDMDNVVVYDVDTWEEHNAALDEIRAKMGRDDWCVLDMMTATWDSVQSWFTDQVFNKDINEYFMEVRKNKADAKKGSSLGAFEGWMDWPVINKEYATIYKRLLRMPGHVYCTAELNQISEDDQKDVRGVFGPYGVKPKGQKRMGHIFKTVLLFTKRKAGDYHLTTVKDRAREEVVDVEIGDFAMDYLKGVGGWKAATSGSGKSTTRGSQRRAKREG